MILRRILSSISTRAWLRHLSRYRKRSHPYKFLGQCLSSICISFGIGMFSRAWLTHWPSRYLRRAIRLAFSVDPGVRTLKDAEASCFALHTLCTCSAAEAASLADVCTTSYLLFTPENGCGRTTSLPIPTVTPSMNFFKSQSHVQAMLSGGEVHGLMIHNFTLSNLYTKTQRCAPFKVDMTARGWQPCMTAL